MSINAYEPQSMLLNNVVWVVSKIYSLESLRAHSIIFCTCILIVQ
jgi:hypothetical protein